MKIKVFLVLAIFTLFSLSCEKEIQVQENQKNTKEENEILKIRLHNKIKKNSLTDSLAKVNKNFKNLINNFNDSLYSLELLRDKTKQNMSYIHPLTLRRKQSLLDTPSVKSRLVLTRLHINKLNYLINKKKIEPDTIEKTLNKIVSDINLMIEIAGKYHRQKDEFKEILEYDSIMKDTTRKFLKIDKKSILQKIKKNK